MKLPQILAEAPPQIEPMRALPSRAPVYEALGHVATGLAQVGEAVFQAQHRAAEARRRAEEARRKQFAQVEAAEGLATWEASIKQHEALVQLTEQDPDRYQFKIAEYARTTAEALRRRLTTPEAQQEVARRLPSQVEQLHARTIAHSQRLFIDRDAGLLTRTLDALEQTYARVPLDQPEEAARIWRDAEHAIEARRSLHGGKFVETSLVKTRERFEGLRVAQHAHTAPEDFLARGPVLYPGADPALMERLRTAAGREIERRETQRLAEEARERARLERERVAARESMERRLGERALRGDLGAEELFATAETYQFSREAVNALHDRITRPKEGPSTDAVLARVGLDAEELYPRTTPEEVDRLHAAWRAGQPGLNFADAVRIKQQLRTTANLHREQRESALIREQDQARRELLAILRITPGMELQLKERLGDDPIARAYDYGTRELRRRSTLFGGQEAPLVIIESLRPGLERVLGQAAQMKAKELRALIGPMGQETHDAIRRSIEEGARDRKLSPSERLQKLELLERLIQVEQPPPPTAPKAPTPRK